MDTNGHESIQVGSWWEKVRGRHDGGIVFCVQEVEAGCVVAWSAPGGQVERNRAGWAWAGPVDLFLREFKRKI
jgi:hypothetical protein